MTNILTRLEIKQREKLEFSLLPLPKIQSVLQGMQLSQLADLLTLAKMLSTFLSIPLFLMMLHCQLIDIVDQSTRSSREKKALSLVCVSALKDSAKQY